MGGSRLLMIKNTNNTRLLARKTCIILYFIHGPSVFSILGKLPIGPRGTCVQVRVVGMTQQ